MATAGPDHVASTLPPDRAGGWLPREEVPVVINSFNRLDCLRGLISWLIRAGQRRLYVVDNASEYPPLRAYLDRLHASGTASVVQLGENVGHLALWRRDLLNGLGITSEFVYTDPDIVPAPGCPADVIGRLQAVLADNEGIAVAGLGLRLDDLPDGYRFKRHAIDWERQFWLAPAAPGLFLAPIDTTFALYRPGSGHCLGRPSVRTGWPCVAAHLGWYIDEERLSDEELFYRRTAARGTSHWSVPELPERLAAAVREQLSRYPQLVHVPATGAGLPGYATPAATGEIDLPAASVDGIYVEGGPACLAARERLRAELLRVVKAGGRLVVHGGPLRSEAVRSVLSETPSWMAGWRLRRAVLAGRAGEGRAVDALMLQLEPAAEGSIATQPEVSHAHLDRWPGFALV